MPVRLMESQYAALEPLRPNEPGLTVDLAADPQGIVDEALLPYGRASTARSERCRAVAGAEQTADVSSVFGLLAQTRDLVVLGGQPGDRQRLERGEFGRLCITACDPFLQLGDLLLEPFDLGGPRVDDLTGLLESSEPSLELLGEVLVGAGPGRLRRR